MARSSREAETDTLPEKKPPALRLAASRLRDGSTVIWKSQFYGQLVLPVGCWKAKV